MSNVIPFKRPKAKPKLGRVFRRGLSKRMIQILYVAEEYEVESGRPLPDLYEPTTSALARRGLLAFCAATNRTDLLGWVLTPAGREVLRQLRIDQGSPEA